MKVRADIATLVREGLTNVEVAHLAGVHPATVAKTRRHLGLAPTTLDTTQLQRLYAEDAPTGTVHDYKHATRTLTPAEQARNRQILADAIDGWTWRDTYAEARRDRERRRATRHRGLAA